MHPLRRALPPPADAITIMLCANALPTTMPSHMPLALPPPAGVIGVMETPFSTDEAQHKVAELAVKLRYQEARAQLAEDLAEHYKTMVSWPGVVGEGWWGWGWGWGVGGGGVGGA